MDSVQSFNFNTYIKKGITGLSLIDNNLSTEFEAFKPLTPNTSYTSEYLSGANILQLDYSFNSDTKPTYSLGSAYPVQISKLGANETINFISETQNLLNVSGQHPDTRVELINKIRLNPISQIWGSTLPNIDIALDNMQVNSTNLDVKPGDLTTFQHSFSKNY